MTSGGDRSEAPFELPDRMRAGRRRRWIVYTAAIAAASVFFAGAPYFLGRAHFRVPAIVLSLIPFPPQWAAYKAVNEMPGPIIGRIVPLASMDYVYLFCALVYVFVYLFVVCLPTLYRRKLLGIPWCLLQIIVLLPGIGCGICYWWWFYV